MFYIDLLQVLLERHRGEGRQEDVLWLDYCDVRILQPCLLQELSRLLDYFQTVFDWHLEVQQYCNDGS